MSREHVVIASTYPDQTYMDTISCPTIVFCLEGAGVSMGKTLARLQRHRNPASPIFVWEIGNTPTIYARQIAGAVASVGQERSAHGTLADAVDEALSSALSIRNTSIASFMQGAVALRLTLLSAAWEVAPESVVSLSEAFRLLGHRYVGRRYWAEACFLLPDLVSDAPPDANERCHRLLRSIEKPPAAETAPVVEQPFAYCWWFGRLNALGLTLSPLPEAENDVATAVAGLLATSPEYLPAPAPIFDGRPTHASAGYSELFIDCADVVDYLTACRAVHLIRNLYLNRAESLEQRRMQTTASAFAGSPDCEGTIRDIAFTPGGERIWSGFHLDIPRELSDGDVQRFRDSLRQAYRKFYETDLRQIQAKVKSSALISGDRLLSRIEVEVRQIAEQSVGGLFDALAFIEQMQTLLFETSDGLENEKATNLQDVRRNFDTAFADRVGLELKSQTNGLGSKVKGLRRKLAEVVRLRNIAAPPALKPAVFDSLVCSIDDKTRLPLMEAIRRLTQDLQEQSTSWAQEKLDEEARLQRLRDQIDQAEGSRESEINKRDGELSHSAGECRRMLADLQALHLSPLQRLLGRFWRTSALRAINKGLRELQDEILPSQARALVMAHADRMQLSVDRVIYDARDGICQAALVRLRELHAKLSEGVKMLDGIVSALDRRNPPSSTDALRRCMLGESDLKYLYERLLVGIHDDDAGCPSAWEVCSEPRARIEKRFMDVAEMPFRKVLEWGLGGFLSILRMPDSRLEEFARWLVSAGKPLLGPGGRQPVDYAVLRACEDTELGRIVRHLLPDASTMRDPCSLVASALQVQFISDLPAAIRCLR